MGTVDPPMDRIAEIAHQPFRTALRHERHSIAGLDAEAHEACREAPHPVDEGSRGPGLEAVGAAAPEEHLAGVAASHVFRQLGERSDQRVLRAGLA